MRIIILILCFLNFGFIQGQDVPIDQIKLLITNASNNTERVEHYIKASQYYTFYNLDSALVFGDSANRLAKQIDYPEGIKNSGLNLAYLYWILGKNSKAIGVLHNTLHQTHSSKLSPLKIYSWLGKNHLQSQKYDSALYWTGKTIQEAKKVQQIQDLVYAYSDYANTYYKKYDFDKAVEYYSKADSVCEQHNLNSVSYLSALGRLGKMKFNSDLYQSAHDYLKAVREKFIVQKNPAGVTEITLSLGMLEYNCDNLDQSLPYLTYCLEYYSKLGMIPKQLLVYKTLGEVYLKQGKTGLAKQHFMEHFRLSSLLNQKDEMTQAQILLGSAYYQEKEYDEAIIHYQRAKNFSLESNDLLLIYSATQGLGNSYIKSSLAEKAAIEFSQIINFQDTVISLKKNEKALALFAEIQAKQKEKKISLLESQNQLALEQKKNQRNVLLGGIGLTSAMGILLFILYRNRQKTNKKLRDIDKMKSDFFANISHEFRTPLTLISAPLEQQLSRNDLKDNDRDDLKMIARSSKRLLSLVDQLLDLSKIEVGAIKLRLEKGNALSFIRAIADSFTYAAKDKNIGYLLDLGTTDELVWFDKDALEKIVVNLLSNAIKYTPESGTVSCSAVLDDHKLKIAVQNTGAGISKVQLKKIFERFYQADEYGEGAGIGLALVNELVALHKGTISAESKSNVYTTFHIVLPVDKKSFQENDILASANENDLHNLLTPDIQEEHEEAEIAEDHRPILLLIDDNRDLRNLLKKTFRKDYTILTAINGEEGHRIALEQVPDLVVSDVMMPKKNGIELANALKQDERTSHIPIILLTAKAGEENELTGINTGADDYITKPFSTRILKSKVAKLIALRKQLQLRYSQEIILKPKDIAITNLDEQFLSKIQTVLDDKLTESNFSTQEFSKNLGMSRMQLHRKLKALTGLTTSEFIRSQRLKLATLLLQNSEANISEIGYQVGFNDPSYFTKCFKEAYGCSPREFTS